MKTQLQTIKETVLQKLEAVKDPDALEALKTEYLGRNGAFTQVMKQLKDAPEEERRELGKLANEVKGQIEEAFNARQSVWAQERRAWQMEEEWIDVTEPGSFPSEGHLHPVSQATEEITDIFKGIGFSRVRAPEIDSDYYAFEALNMPADHPARDDWETFFIDQAFKGDDKPVLTPHTSNAQVRTMEQQEPPIRMINIGKTYRRQITVSHVPMFHQFEGMLVDKGVSITHLKGVLDYFVKMYFGPERKTRLRPHHFRFTEPSFEVDISCDVCGGDPEGSCRLCKAGWLELGGAGMVHPNVLKAGGLDPNVYSGFAFGWGVERTLMMREGIKIDDIRILYKNDLRFVTQF